MSSASVITEKAKLLYREERENHKILNGWFLSREIAADAAEGELEAIVENCRWKLVRMLFWQALKEMLLLPAMR